TEVAQKNEELAAGFAQEKRNQTAHEFYLRAADFYRRAVVYMAEGDPRMLPTFKKLEENFAKAWSLVPPPFERVEIPYEGHKLPAHFWPGRGKAGAKLPVVYNYGGADGILLRGEDGGAGQYVRRGMSFIDVDGPGQGGSSGPRCATAEKRIKAVAVWSGAYNLVEDIFDYYPPIQERLRWLMGARD